MTLEPGIYEPGDAPWWVFSADDIIVTCTRQWMADAALYFAEHLAKINWGGEVRVAVDYTSLDGFVGYYNVVFENHALPVVLVVRRGEMVEEPHDE